MKTEDWRKTLQDAIKQAYQSGYKDGYNDATWKAKEEKELAKQLKEPWEA